MLNALFDRLSNLDGKRMSISLDSLRIFIDILARNMLPSAFDSHVEHGFAGCSCIFSGLEPTDHPHYTLVRASGKHCRVIKPPAAPLSHVLHLVCVFLH